MLSDYEVTVVRFVAFVNFQHYLYMYQILLKRLMSHTVVYLHFPEK